MIWRKTNASATQTSQPDGLAAVEMQLGDRLRGERATLGKSLLDVQRELKIKASFVAAIENCDLSVFETPSFVAGYVRSYARYLGLSPEEIFAQFCRESGFAPVNGSGLGGVNAVARGARPAGGVARAGEGAARDPFAEANARFMPRGEAAFTHIEFGAIGSLLAVLALIGGLGYGGWAILREVQRVPVAEVETVPLSGSAQLAETAPAPVPALAPLLPQGVMGAGAEGTAPALASSEVLMERLYRPQALDMPVLISRDGPIAAIDPSKTGALARQAAAAAPPLLGPGLPAGEDVQVSAPEAPAVALVAARPAWVRVSAADGTVLFEKTLDAGERYIVPQMEVPALLRAGNSSAIYFLVNGQTYGPAAAGPEVVKDVPLSAEALHLAYQPADPAADAELAKAVALAEAVQNPAGEEAALAPVTPIAPSP